MQSTWNLLLLATASLTISVSLLLWLLADFLEVLRQAETRGEDIYARRLLQSSLRVAILVAGMLLVSFAGLLSLSVAYASLPELGIRPFSIQFYLLLICASFPILGALATAILLAERVGSQSVLSSFSNLLRRFYTQPMRFSFDLPNQQLRIPLSDLPPGTRQEWQAASAWVSEQARRWYLGRNFLEENHQELTNLVANTWNAATERDSISDPTRLPYLLVDPIKCELAKSHLTDALLGDRPLAIAKAACALAEPSTKRASLPQPASEGSSPKNEP